MEVTYGIKRNGNSRSGCDINDKFQPTIASKLCLTAGIEHSMDPNMPFRA